MKTFYLLVFLGLFSLDSVGQFNRNLRSAIVPDSVDGVFLSERNERLLPAEYPGGWYKFLRYLRRKTRYPADAKLNNVQGAVYVAFTVDKDGRVKNDSVKPVRKLFDSCDKEAVAVIRKCRKWRPGRNLDTNQNIETHFVVPVMFKL